jgi:uncharacterized protein (TIGR03437 family)
LKNVLRSCIFLTAVGASWGQAPNVTGVANALSFAVGGIAPGEELSVFGANLAASTNSNCSSGGGFPTTCSGTSVQINNIAAPIIYVSATQVNLYAPLELYGGSVTLQVKTAGGTSSPVALNVVPAAPGTRPREAWAPFSTKAVSSSQPPTRQAPATSSRHSRPVWVSPIRRLRMASRLPQALLTLRPRL